MFLTVSQFDKLGDGLLETEKRRRGYKCHHNDFFLLSQSLLFLTPHNDPLHGLASYTCAFFLFKHCFSAYTKEARECAEVVKSLSQYLQEKKRIHEDSLPVTVPYPFVDSTQFSWMLPST